MKPYSKYAPTEDTNYAAPNVDDVLKHPIVVQVEDLARSINLLWLDNSSFPGAWDQLCRALLSVGLNVCEGLGRTVGGRPQFFSFARGSAYETALAIRFALPDRKDLHEKARLIAQKVDTLVLSAINDKAALP